MDNTIFSNTQDDMLDCLFENPSIYKIPNTESYEIPNIDKYITRNNIRNIKSVANDNPYILTYEISFNIPFNAIYDLSSLREKIKDIKDITDTEGNIERRMFLDDTNLAENNINILLEALSGDLSSHDRNEMTATIVEECKILEHNVFLYNLSCKK